MNVNDPKWVKIVLDELDEVKEDLVILYEDIQHDADNRDPVARRESLAVLTEFNVKFEPLERAVAGMIEFIERVTGVQRDAGGTSAPELMPVMRTVRALDPNEPHAITEDFRWTKPNGFMLSDQKAQASAWNQLYALFCTRLAERDPKRFEGLPDVPEFSDSNPSSGFSRSPAPFRDVISLPHGVYCEGSLSARNIASNIRRLLAHFGIPEGEIVVYLREDRDAE